MKANSQKDFLSLYKKKESNIYVLTGDEFDIGEVIDYIKNDFPRDLIEIYFRDDEEQLIQTFGMNTLFGKRLIIIYELDTFTKSTREKIINKFRKTGKKLTDSIIITFKDPKRIPSIKNSIKGNFKIVYESDIPDWIRAYLKEKNEFKISDKAIDFLTFSLGNNRKELKKQLDLIISQKDNKLITESDVKSTGYFREDTIFKISNSVVKRNYKRAIEYLLEYKDNKPVLYFLNGDLRRLLSIRAALDLNLNIKKMKLHDKLNIHSYFFYKRYLPSARKVKFEELKINYDRIMDSEYKIKNGWNEFSINFNYISQLR